MKRINYKDCKLTLAIIHSLNESSHNTDIIKSVLRSIKQHTNIEAAGIRLKAGEDFPYYTTTGFSEEFVEAERFLCSRDEHGTIIRDENYNPVLECMCGNILCGRTDPALPFFSNRGSFFSNCTTQLLAETSEEERQGRTRNRCNGEGYESVALIPLRIDGEIIGLLQLNDRQKNMFSPQDIQFFEELGESIGIALHKMQQEECIMMMNQQLEKKVEKRTKELKKSLQEKNLLLREVHHRVKNNLYTIISFLNLQALNTSNRAARNALVDAAMRVQSVGTIHKKLYLSNEYIEVDIGNYLNDLFVEIYQSYKISFDKIAYEINCDNVRMNIDTAIPCGLIINEIVVNSMKHAYPGDLKGMIRINIEYKDDSYFLKVSDNGVGFDKDATCTGESLGKMIIESLVKQLGGTIDCTSKKGVVYHITFKRVTKEEQRWKKKGF